MKRLIVVLSLVVGAWMLSPTPEAQARSWGSGSQKASKNYKHYKSNKGGSSVPEVDPSAAGSAMVLLLGGMALIASRRREEDLA